MKSFKFINIIVLILFLTSCSHEGDIDGIKIITLLIVSIISVGIFFLSLHIQDKYDFDIFGKWILSRIILGTSAYFYFTNHIGIFILGVMLLWNLIVTWKNTNWWIALITIILQPLAFIGIIISIFNTIREFIYYLLPE